MGQVRAHVFIEGSVQGVFFRARARDQALRLGLKGWVKNTPDGRVEAVFEGEKAQVERMVDWCHLGPPSARVAGVRVSREEPGEEFSTFSVKY